MKEGMRENRQSQLCVDKCSSSRAFRKRRRKARAGAEKDNYSRLRFSCWLSISLFAPKQIPLKTHLVVLRSQRRALNSERWRIRSYWPTSLSDRRSVHRRPARSQASMWRHLACCRRRGHRPSVVAAAAACSWELKRDRCCYETDHRRCCLSCAANRAWRVRVRVFPTLAGRPSDASGRCHLIQCWEKTVETEAVHLYQKSMTSSLKLLSLSSVIFLLSSFFRKQHTRQTRIYFFLLSGGNMGKFASNHSDDNNALVDASRCYFRLYFLWVFCYE